MLPSVSSPTKKDNPDVLPQQLYVHNVHPMMAMYKHDLVTEHLPYDNFCDLHHSDKAPKILQFLTEMCLLDK